MSYVPETELRSTDMYDRKALAKRSPVIYNLSHVYAERGSSYPIRQYLYLTPSLAQVKQKLNA